MKLYTVALLFAATSVAIVKASSDKEGLGPIGGYGMEAPKATAGEEEAYGAAKALARDLIQRAKFERSAALGMELQETIIYMEYEAARGGFYAANYSMQANRLRASFIPFAAQGRPEGKRRPASPEPRAGLAARGDAAPEKEEDPELAEAIRLSLSGEPRPAPAPAPAALARGPKVVPLSILENPFFEAQGGDVSFTIAPGETHATLIDKIKARFAAFGFALNPEHLDAMILTVILNNNQVVDVEKNNASVLTTPANPIKKVTVTFLDDEDEE